MKFTIVTPTQWKYKPFADFLIDLCECDDVGEIIILDNEPTSRPTHSSLTHKKVKILDDKNRYVNPAWNYGVEIAVNDYICLLNDDVVFDLKVLKKVASRFNDRYAGIFGLNPGVADFNQKPVTTGIIEITEHVGEHTYGFGCLMFFHKDSWIKIPDGLNVYYGDNWIFDTQLALGKRNYIITNMLHHTPFAITTSQLENKDELLSTEGIVYQTEIEKFRRRLEVVRILETEYKNVCAFKSDINEHVPTLKHYADMCESVTEFGVRTGISTRAFLVSGTKKLRSYDLYIDGAVKQLFDLASEIEKDFLYQVADTRVLDIEETDLLFIDTDHSYKQLSIELAAHASKVKKFLVFHDVVSYATALMPAIIEFLQKNSNWCVEFFNKENNGLLVLRNQNA